MTKYGRSEIKALQRSSISQISSSEILPFKEIIGAEFGNHTLRV